MVARAPLAAGTLLPGLRAGNLGDVAAVDRAMRQVLEGVAAKGGERGRYVTLVIPDAAVRVLLIDFDALPPKAAEALPIVRFRLKKLLPFDVEHALVSYQPMPAEVGVVKVLAVAIPREVLAEYEALVTRAGYAPGAVLPSTLAAVAGLEGPAAALVVNADASTVTTAIVRDGALLLHRTVDVSGGGEAAEAEFPAKGTGLRLVDRESSAEEWARQEPLGYDRLEAEAAMQSEVLGRIDMAELGEAAERAVSRLNQAAPVNRSREIAQAVSVAAAYFEDTLRAPVAEVLVAGTMGADRLRELLAENGMEDVRVRELVSDAAIAAIGSAVNGSLRRGAGALAGVRGALRG